MKENRYYVYIYLDPTNIGHFIYGDLYFEMEPFYVGKGCRARDVTHLREIKNKKANYNSHKNNRINKILSQGLDPLIIRLKKDLFEYEAYQLETETIVKIGRRDQKTGPLTNQNDGGTVQANLSKEISTKISEAIKSLPDLYTRFKGDKNPMFGVHRFGETAPRFGIACTEENKKRYSEIHKGKRYSPKSEFTKGQVPWNKGLRGAQKAWNKGLKKSDYENR